MSILAFNFLYGTEGDHIPVVRKYDSMRSAISDRNDWFMPKSIEELADQDILAPTHLMVELLNALDPENPVEGTPEREDLARRLWDVCQSTLNESEPIMSTASSATKRKSAETAAKPKAAAKKAPAKKAPAKKGAPPAAGRGRTSALANHKLVHSIKKDAEGSIVNPRRSGSAGHASMEIIIKAGDAGISTEDFLKKGGRMTDLNWDVEKGNVKATPIK